MQTQRTKCGSSRLRQSGRFSPERSKVTPTSPSYYCLQKIISHEAAGSSTQCDSIPPCRHPGMSTPTRSASFCCQISGEDIQHMVCCARTPSGPIKTPLRGRDSPQRSGSMLWPKFMLNSAKTIGSMACGTVMLCIWKPTFKQNGLWQDAQLIYESAQLQARSGDAPFNEQEYCL